MKETLDTYLKRLMGPSQRALWMRSCSLFVVLMLLHWLDPWLSAYVTEGVGFIFRDNESWTLMEAGMMLSLTWGVITFSQRDSVPGRTTTFLVFFRLFWTMLAVAIGLNVIGALMSRYRFWNGGLNLLDLSFLVFQWYILGLGILLFYRRLIPGWGLILFVLLSSLEIVGLSYLLWELSTADFKAELARDGLGFSLRTFIYPTVWFCLKLGTITSLYIRFVIRSYQPNPH